MYSRRQFHKLALSAIPLSAMAARLDSHVNGVLIGVQSYSFRDRPLDEAIQAIAEVGFSECELWQGHMEPRIGRSELRTWRTTIPLDAFRQTRQKFDDAGIEIYAYNYSFQDDFTAPELQRGFEMAKALGTDKITASATLSVVKRIDPVAKEYRTYVGFHGHSNTKDPNQFAKPESFLEAMRGRSKFMCINLDIGHFTAAGYDPVDFIEKHHDRILTLHIKDRRKDDGPNVPFGQGDTPIKAVLQLLKAKQYKIPANIEYEYEGGNTIAEVKKCFEYCKEALA